MLLNSLPKRNISIHKDFTHFLSTAVVTAPSHALWRFLSNKVICVLGHCWDDIPHTHTSERDSLLFKGICSPPSRSRRVTWIMPIEVLLVNGFYQNSHNSEPTIASTDLRICATGCMHTRQLPYEIVGDCSDKGGWCHRHQPLDRFILWEVLASRRVMFMLHVMMYVVSHNLLWNWVRAVRFVSHEVCSDGWFFVLHFLHLFLQIVSLWSLSIWIRIIFNTDELVNQTRHCNQMHYIYIHICIYI